MDQVQELYDKMEKTLKINNKFFSMTPNVKDNKNTNDWGLKKQSLSSQYTHTEQMHIANQNQVKLRTKDVTLT